MSFLPPFSSFVPPAETGGWSMFKLLITIWFIRATRDLGWTQIGRWMKADREKWRGVGWEFNRSVSANYELDPKDLKFLFSFPFEGYSFPPSAFPPAAVLPRKLFRKRCGKVGKYENTGFFKRKTWKPYDANLNWHFQKRDERQQTTSGGYKTTNRLGTQYPFQAPVTLNMSLLTRISSNLVTKKTCNAT